MIVDIPWLAKQNFNFKRLMTLPTLILYHTKEQRPELKNKILSNHNMA